MEALGDGVEGLVPGDLFKGFQLATLGELAFREASFAAQGMDDALRRVDTVEILGDFAAEKALRYGVRGISLNLDGAAFGVDGDQDGAGVRAVVRADCMDDPESFCARGHRVIVE